MGMKKDIIRPLALAVIRKGNKVLVFPGYDHVKEEKFYRLLGGGIDFGETSLKAVKREIKEELAAELKDIRLEKVVENIFEYNGDKGHEICFVYEAEFADSFNYDKEEFDILDTPGEEKAIWLDINEGQAKRIYPENCL